MGHRLGIAVSLANLGTISYYEGDNTTARSLNEESLTIYRDLGERRGIASSLETFASLALKEKRGERAVRLWGAASGLREEIGSPLPPNALEKQEQELAAVRAAWGEDALFAAWEEGRSMTLDQAISYSLDAKESG